MFKIRGKDIFVVFLHSFRRYLLQEKSIHIGPERENGEKVRLLMLLLFTWDFFKTNFNYTLTFLHFLRILKNMYTQKFHLQELSPEEHVLKCLYVSIITVKIRSGLSDE